MNEQIRMPVYDLASYPGCLQDGVERDNYELLPALPKFSRMTRQTFYIIRLWDN